MVTVIVAEVSPNLLSLTRHAGLILAGIPVEESESESRSKKIQMDLRTPFSPYYHIEILPSIQLQCFGTWQTTRNI